MATYDNQSKSSTTFANQDRSTVAMTWDEAEFPWDEAEGTWDDPRTTYDNQSKSSTTFVNDTKN